MLEFIIKSAAILPNEEIIKMVEEELDKVKKRLEINHPDPWAPMKPMVMLLSFKIEVGDNPGKAKEMLDRSNRIQKTFQKGIDLENLEREMNDMKKGDNYDKC